MSPCRATKKLGWLAWEIGSPLIQDKLGSTLAFMFFMGCHKKHVQLYEKKIEKNCHRDDAFESRRTGPALYNLPPLLQMDPMLALFLGTDG